MPEYVATYQHGTRINVTVALCSGRSETLVHPDFLVAARRISLHVVAHQPYWITPADVPDVAWLEELAQHRKALDRLEPAESRARVAWLRDRFERDRCLMRQPFIDDPSCSVAEYLADVARKVQDEVMVVRFECLVADAT